MVTGPCVALSHGTLCLNRTADDPELVRYFPVGSDTRSVPALPAELATLLSTSEPRVLLRLRETSAGTDILLGFPFARDTTGRVLIIRLTSDVSSVQLVGDVDFAVVPPDLRRFCGASAVAWPIRYSADAFAISCGNLTAVVGTFVRPTDSIRSELLLPNRVTAGRYRLIPPADCCTQSNDGSGVLYAHWCDPSPEVVNNAELCISRIGAGGRIRELLRRRIRSWSEWSVTIGSSVSGEDRLLLGWVESDGANVTVQSIRVEPERASLEWASRFRGSSVEFLQTSIVQ